MKTLSLVAHVKSLELQGVTKKVHFIFCSHFWTGAHTETSEALQETRQECSENLQHRPRKLCNVGARKKKQENMQGATKIIVISHITNQRKNRLPATRDLLQVFIFLNSTTLCDG